MERSKLSFIVCRGILHDNCARAPHDPAGRGTRAREPPHRRRPRRSHQTQPSGRQRKSGFQTADRGHHRRAAAVDRRVVGAPARPAARPPNRHEATKPPPRAHLANELGSLPRVPCFSSSLPVDRYSCSPRRLSADGGPTATRPFRRPRHTPKARLSPIRKVFPTE